MTTHEQPQILRGFPSLSILHNPDHSPNFLCESTRTKGIWCSLQSAVTNFLYCGSSQLSANIHNTAWRLWEIKSCIQKSLSNKFEHAYLSRALQDWWIPWTRPSTIKDFFNTSWSAALISELSEETSLWIQTG